MDAIYFQDRQEAGRLLAQQLMKYRGQAGVVYALPRGGVVLGAEIARALDMPLDLLIPRKVGYPGNPEYAVCAVTEDGYQVCNQAIAATLDPAWLEAEIEKEQQEAKRRRETYLAGREAVNAAGKVAIIVDDGIATGLTMQAAVLQVKDRRPLKAVVAVPVVPPEAAILLSPQVDELVVLDIPPVYLGAVGAYYQEFPPVADEEVISLLQSTP